MKEQRYPQSSSEELYRNIVDHSEVGICLVDMEGKGVFVNHRATQIIGMPAEALTGNPLGENLSKEDKIRTREAFLECVETGYPVPGFTVNWTVENETRHALMSFAPVHGQSDDIVGVQVIIIDVTDLAKAEQSAIRMSELYRGLLDATGSEVVRVDRSGRRTFVNKHTLSSTGRSEEDWMNGRFGDLVIDEDISTAEKLLKEAFETGKPVYGFVSRQKRNGQIRHILANWAPIRDGNGDIVELQITSTDITDQIRMRESYSSLVRKAQEQERLHISRLLHDDTIQNLIAISNMIRSIATGATNESPMSMKLESVRDALLDQIQALRGLSMSLRPVILDRMGLDAAIEWFVREACSGTNMDGSVELKGSWMRLGPVSEIHLYRIIQEAVNNAVRHAEASMVRVTLEMADGFIDIRIRDNGKGFEEALSKEELLLQGHMGLMGMQEHAAALGARLDIETKRGKGSTIRVFGSVADMQRASSEI